MANLFSSGTMGGIGTPLNFNVFWIPVTAGSTITAGTLVYLDTTAGTWAKATTSFVSNTIYGVCNDDVDDSTDEAGPIISVTCWGLANITIEAETTYGALLTVSASTAGYMQAVTTEIGEGLAKTFCNGGTGEVCTVFFNGFGDTDTDTGGT